MDYLRAGLPVVASVEPDSDFAEMIIAHDVGASVPLGDDEGLYRAVEGFARGGSADGDRQRRAQRFLDEELDVRHCYRRLMEAVQGSEGE
jgi:hypothetical protein